MANVKIAVIYYSATGTNYQMALEAEKAAKEAGAEVRVRRVKELAPSEAIATNPQWKAHVDVTQHVQEATLDDLDWADGIIFSVPTRFGNMAAQMKQFLDTAGPLWGQGKLVNKTVTAMSSAQNPHGGQEATILSLYTTMYHWGAIVVAPGYTDQTIFGAGGNPYGASATAGGDKVSDEVLAAVRHQTKRLIEITERIASPVHADR
ncbi:NAD(P)H:quinone oxidoreductase [Sulfobacillus harzensis]|uniref:NAD(P)H:quinone oxidoreductase n=1 Tax=Sulfobacillus harzensis TaxID=2729629 RepID=A0A7Y0L205_9FIRM|nr:NAD(P)H:quinone oxidoreductase [Sulfobacillus harzensis]NMP21760.1 NAD(P)H:quinone oxidoreductase [Sulfobacillus harzensis]